MGIRRMHEWLYLTNATVLLVHQMDAAYWHEWTLFGLPGGIQFYLLLNLPIVLPILYGVRALALGHRAGLVMSWVLVAAGLFAAGFHAFHLLSGDAAFTLPVSIGLLVATGVLSIAQAGCLLRLVSREVSPGQERPEFSNTLR
jgi:hypothetical protein